MSKRRMVALEAERRLIQTDRYQSNPFYLRVWGDYALFTDPLTKAGGEKLSYQVPTYQALKGIVEACYWKPVLYYVIDEVKIMKPIQTETHGIRAPLNGGGNDLNSYTYLKDVEYWIQFHFEWNEQRQDLTPDRNEKKHQEILIRSMKKGGRRDVFLGTRECVAYLAYLSQAAYEQRRTAFEGERRSFGIQFHSFTYPSENFAQEGEEIQLISNFSPVIMEDGCIRFPRPEACDIHHCLSTYQIKVFKQGDYQAVDEEFRIAEKDEAQFPLIEEGDM